MYCEYYGFTERPFSLLPDPSFLYLGKKHQSALSMLLYSLNNQAGFCVLSGEIGAGKTTLIRELLDEVDDDVTVGLVNNYSPTTTDLLTNVLVAFGLDSKEARDDAAKHQLFSEFLIEQYANNRRTLLIFDEAQHLSVEVLESLRMLSNINADKDMLLQVMLVGQNELRDRLRQPELAQFAQRIVIDFHLQPLDQQETIEYIRHRIEVVGGKPETFTRLACISVYAATNGIPRLINLLCDTSLVYGYGEGESKHISKEIVNQVIRDRQGGSLLPLFETDAEISGVETEEDFNLDSNDINETDISEVDLSDELDTQEITESDIESINLSGVSQEINTKDGLDSEAADVVDNIITGVEKNLDDAAIIQDIESEVVSPPNQPDAVDTTIADIEAEVNEAAANIEKDLTKSGSDGFSEEVRQRRQEQIEKLSSEKGLEEIMLDSGAGSIPFSVQSADSANADIPIVIPPIARPDKKASYLPGMLIAFVLGILAFTAVSFNVTGEWLWETSLASEDFIEKFKNRFKI